MDDNARAVTRSALALALAAFLMAMTALPAQAATFRDLSETGRNVLVQEKAAFPELLDIWSQRHLTLSAARDRGPGDIPTRLAVIGSLVVLLTGAAPANRRRRPGRVQRDRPAWAISRRR